MRGGAEANENRAGLGHIQGIERARHGNFKHDRAAFCDARAQPPVFIAKHEDCRQRPGKLKGAGWGEGPGMACAIDGKARFFGLIQTAGQVGSHAGGHEGERSGRGAHRSRAKGRGIVLWQQQSGAAERPGSAAERAEVARILDLVKRENQVERRGLGQEICQGLRSGLFKYRDNALVGDPVVRACRAEFVQLPGIHSDYGNGVSLRKRHDFGGSAAVVFEKDFLDAPRRKFNEFKNWLQAWQKLGGRLVHRNTPRQRVANNWRRR